ncbi:hypothetical protein [Novosphingobium terrae]|uniref:hypothetical protein n=1 Tax=Novosphingobium terrae TaxID=2726189 RepID=UPI00197D2A92|nr:hypothetical protein [Novosphingobium terrae]
MTMAMGMGFASVACAREAAGASAPEAAIIYENEAPGLCYDCTRVRIAVTSEGQVSITRWRVGPGAYGHTGPVMTQDKVSRARVRAFARALAPYRPSEGRVKLPTACSVFVTEAGGLTIGWSDSLGHQQLNVDYGCDPARYRAMFGALRDAPHRLGLGDLLGSLGSLRHARGSSRQVLQPAHGANKKAPLPQGSGASS